MRGRKSGPDLQRPTSHPCRLASYGHAPHRHAPCSGARVAGARNGGYTLIEVIVAFGLLAAALAMLLGAQTQASRQVADADKAGRAAMYARSLLDEAGVGEALAEGRRDGEFEDGRYRWEWEVKPYVDPIPNPQAQNPGEIIGAPRLLLLRLTVRWGEGGPRERLQLDALRLVTPTGDLGTVQPP